MRLSDQSRPPNKEDQFRKLLKEALVKCYESCGTVLNRLIDKIAEANNYQPGMTVERRKLLELLTTDRHVKLTTLELQGLDTYFSEVQMGGLSGILKRRSLLQLAGASGRVVFFISAKRNSPHGYHNNVSYWDLRSIISMMRVIDRTVPGVHFDIQEVPLRALTPSSAQRSPRDAFRKEEWYDTIYQKNGPSVISLGSPRANHASECVLSTMLEREPFGTRGTASTEKADLPFRFAWQPDETERIASTFIAPWSAIPGNPRRNDDVYGAIQTIDGQTYLCSNRSATHDDFGIVICQKRPSDQRVFMCLAGLTGPSTFAGAQVLASASLELPPDNPSVPKALWALVKTEVVVEKDAAGGSKHTTRNETLVTTQVWPRDSRND